LHKRKKVFEFRTIGGILFGCNSVIRGRQKMKLQKRCISMPLNNNRVLKEIAILEIKDKHV
jgi:hypothetical protein